MINAHQNLNAIAHKVNNEDTIKYVIDGPSNLYVHKVLASNHMFLSETPMLYRNRSVAKKARSKANKKFNGTCLERVADNKEMITGIDVYNSSLIRRNKPHIKVEITIPEWTGLSNKIKEYFKIILVTMFNMATLFAAYAAFYKFALYEGGESQWYNWPSGISIVILWFISLIISLDLVFLQYEKI